MIKKILSLFFVVIFTICSCQPVYASSERIALVSESIEIPETLALSFAGDRNLDENRCTTLTLNQQANGIYDCIAPVLISRMQQADIFMPNNEFTYSERGAKLPNKAWTFRAHPSRVNVMKELGADIVLLANNHCYDYGAESLYDTLDTLENAGIAYVGAGRTLDTAIQPYYFQYGDLIIGSHPHVLQGIEYYQGKPIMYSLGNFWFNAKTMYTCLYELEIDTATETLSGVRFIPAIQKNCKASYPTDFTTQREIYDFEQSISIDIVIDDNGYVYPAS